MTQPVSQPTTDPRRLGARYREIRATTERLCEPLSTEDYVVQSMPDVSPTKWHLAHVSWFFETFILKSQLPQYRPSNSRFEYLFNSYYNSVGEQYPRPDRGLLTRPSVDEVFAYRAHVDQHMNDLLEGSGELTGKLSDLVVLGLNHEQQHQELILMDIKHVLSRNPLYPAYKERADEPRGTSIPPVGWVTYPEGVRSVGHHGPKFCFDNELPRHQVCVPAVSLGSRLVTNAEYLKFMEDGGYRRPQLWLADGWTTVQREEWEAPLYWVRKDGEWWEFTLAGLRPPDPNAPVCHVSYFEADAYANWTGFRLPTEAEWEVAALEQPIHGNFIEDDRLHPAPLGTVDDGSRPSQMYGDVWEWTRSAYAPYPGFQPTEGAIGEYNGKFMCNQYVLRGGACVTPRSHIRPSYRNFFYPHCRWQFSGIRLARDE